MVEVRLLFCRRLVEDDIFYNHRVDGIDGGFLDVYVGDGIGCHCSLDDYEGGLVVAKFLLQSVESSCVIVMPG